MGLRCDGCLEDGITAFEKYAKKRDVKVTVKDYDGKYKCGGCGKKDATKILSYS